MSPSSAEGFGGGAALLGTTMNRKKAEDEDTISPKETE